MRGFHVDSDSHADTSSGEESPYPETPEHEYFPPIYEDEPGFKFREGSVEEEVAAVSPRILPLHAGQGNAVDVQAASMSFMERCLYWMSPYEELKEAEAAGDTDKAEKVLGRLLTEWYVVGASVSCSCSHYVVIKRTKRCSSYWALPVSTQRYLDSPQTACSLSKGSRVRRCPSARLRQA